MTSIGFSNSLPSKQPAISASQNMQNNGGGGNTGYFSRGRRRGKDDKDINIFSEEFDAFGSSSYFDVDMDLKIPSFENETKKFSSFFGFLKEKFAR